MNRYLTLLAAAVSLSAFAADDLVGYVKTEMGTVNTCGRNSCSVSTGNLFPMVARPWGFGGWTPQTRADGTSRWYYDYNDERLYGIRYTRQPSPWIGDHGSWTFLPVTGEPAEDVTKRCSWYSHKTETFGPDRYGVYLADFDASVDIAPTLHGAVSRITYGQTEKPGLVVNPLKDGTVALGPDRRTVTGCSVWNVNRRGWGAPVKMRFVLRLSRPAVASRQLADGSLYVAFAPVAKGERVEMKAAVSFISDEQALVNLRETDGKDFAAVQREARAEWNARLGRIRVESADVDKLRTFYTCFYRTMLFPLAVWERTAAGRIVHWSPSTGETCDGYYYGGTGFWDTFRALFPLLNFLAPEMNARMMEGLQNCWKECGWLPEWSSPGLSNCMIGNNSASVVADAWLSGVRGNFDINELWKAVVHGANNAHPTMQAVGRCGVEHYNAKGYVPRDVGVRESGARTLEYAYDDWCIAELGRAIGRPAEEVAVYRQRSGNWRNVFDSARRIVVGRNADGSFNKDFDPFTWGGDFTEGCAHHYTWSVFHDVPGLAEAMGGRKEFERRLDEIFTLPPTFDTSAYKTVIHEMREMQIMRFGQYAHGNQPIQHMIYLYDWTDAPAKAGKWAREAMDCLYRPTPDGYCGDEDNGQTSAWYVWSAMGLYPVCPASGEYATGCPLFDKLTVSLPNGRKLVIRAPGAEGRKFPAAPAPRVKKADLDKGGELVFGATSAVREVTMLPDEKWWGLDNNFGREMPFTARSAFACDLRKDNYSHQALSLLVSDKGRVLWCPEPVGAKIAGGKIRLEADKGEIVLRDDVARTLADAYRFASKTWFKPTGEEPELLYFAAPQYNTWIELTYNQNEKDILGYAQSMLDHGFPPGVFMIDDTWQAGYGDWRFEPTRFSDPKGMVEKLHKMGYKVLLWTCPFVSMDTPAFRRIAWGSNPNDVRGYPTKGGFINESPKKSWYGVPYPAAIKWWNGCSALLDFTHPNAVAWYDEQLDGLKRDFGVDGFKFDGGSVSFYSGTRDATGEGGGAPKSFVHDPKVSAAKQSALYGEFVLKHKGSEYRNCFGFAGKPVIMRLHDKDHSWSALQRLVPDMLAAGFVGCPFICPDMVGGGSWSAFLPGAPFSEELFVRSAQVQALCPMMQFSASPWRYLNEKNQKIIAETVALRQKFAPHFVELAKKAAKDGEPIMRNLEYAYPGLGYADVKDEFLMGEDLLVAPVVTEGAKTREVVIPPGRWRADDGQVVEGPKTVAVETPLSRLPHFVREK